MWIQRVLLWRLDDNIHLESKIDIERILSRLDDSKSSARRRRSEASVVCLAPNSRDPKLLIACSGSDSNTIRMVVYSVTGDCVMASEEFRDSQSSSTSTLPPFVPVTSAMMLRTFSIMKEEDEDDSSEIDNLKKILSSSAIALACTRGFVYIIDSETGALIRKFKIPHAIIVTSLALISSKSLVASSRGLIFRWKY